MRTEDQGGPCVKTAFTIRIAVDADGLEGVKVKLDGRTIKTSEEARFKLRVRAFGLKKGRHTLKIIARGEGGRTVQRATFFRVQEAGGPALRGLSDGRRGSARPRRCRRGARGAVRIRPGGRCR